MLRGIYTAASGMKNSQFKQDATANNIANSETTGYKQDEIATGSFKNVMVYHISKENGRKVAEPIGELPFGVRKGDVYIDFKQGMLQETGSTMDMAIEGKGFFMVSGSDGINEVRRLTRDGSFKVDGDGRIVTSDGSYVLGRDISTGTVGPMEVGTGKVAVDSKGNVSVDLQKKYSLVICDVDDYNGLNKVGGNMYEVPQDVREADEGSFNIRQGFIEGSNVDMADQMVNMITNLRSYQANQKVLQSIDETLSKTVNDVGAVK